MSLLFSLSHQREISCSPILNSSLCQLLSVCLKIISTSDHQWGEAVMPLEASVGNPAAGLQAVRKSILKSCEHERPLVRLLCTWHLAQSSKDKTQQNHICMLSYLLGWTNLTCLLSHMTQGERFAVT